MKRILYIYGIFFIESFLENYSDWFLPKIVTNDDYYYHVHVYAKCISFEVLLTWIILMTVKYFMPFNFWDRVTIYVCFVFDVVNAFSYLWNAGDEYTKVAWLTFLTANIILMYGRFGYKRGDTIKFFEWK